MSDEKAVFLEHDDWEQLVETGRVGLEKIPNDEERETIEELLEEIETTDQYNVHLERTKWVRVMAVCDHGRQGVADETADRVDELLDEIVDQTEICIVDLMDLEMEFRQRGPGAA